LLARSFWAAPRTDFRGRIGNRYRKDNDWDWKNIEEENETPSDGVSPNLGCGLPITSLINSRPDLRVVINQMQP
jgi:hypothetical protein